MYTCKCYTGCVISVCLESRKKCSLLTTLCTKNEGYTEIFAKIGSKKSIYHIFVDHTIFVCVIYHFTFITKILVSLTLVRNA